jgi:hypothetical protein
MVTATIAPEKKRPSESFERNEGKERMVKKKSRAGFLMREKKALQFGTILLIILGLTSGCLLSSAVQAMEFKVYSYMTPNEGEVELAYWNVYVARSDLSQPWKDGSTIQREGLFSDSLEVEYGLTDRWAISAYADFQNPRGENFEYVGAKAVVTRYRFFEPDQRFLDTAIYVEYVLPNHQFSEAQEEIELRLILEKNLYPLIFLFNPIFEKDISGPGVEEGLEFEYAAGGYFAVNRRVTLGVEFYGATGPLNNFNSPANQQHYIFPAARLKLYPGFLIDLGVGFGLTQASDDLTSKVILEYEFN